MRLTKDNKDSEWILHPLARPSFFVFFGALFFFLISFATLFFYTRRLGLEYADLRATVSTARFETERKSKMAQVGSLVRGSAVSIESLKKLFVTDSNIVPFVESIESLGRALPVRLSLSSVNLAPSHDNFTARLSASGNLSDLHRLLGLLELLPYKVSLDEVQMIYGGSGDGSVLQVAQSGKKELPRWSATISLTVESVIPERR